MPEASYILRLEPRPHHLRAHVCGPEDTLEVSIGYWTEIAAACAQGDVRRLLVIEEIEGTARQTTSRRWPTRCCSSASTASGSRSSTPPKTRPCW